MRLSAVFLCAGLMALAGCTSVDTSVTEQTDLSKYQRFYVQSAANDNNHLDVLLARELQTLGRQANSGVRTLMPNDAQAVVTYEQQWNWEFGDSYLFRLDVNVRDVRTEELLCHGTIVHPGLRNGSPEQMVHAVLAKLFPKKK